MTALGKCCRREATYQMVSGEAPLACGCEGAVRGQATACSLGIKPVASLKHAKTPAELRTVGELLSRVDRKRPPRE